MTDLYEPAPCSRRVSIWRQPHWRGGYTWWADCTCGWSFGLWPPGERPKAIAAAARAHAAQTGAGIAWRRRARV